MEGTGRPEYGKVVDIVTKDSLRELVTPGILAVLAPVAVTVFTASDFGRTLSSNGRGSDHAWGGNHLVMGGAVTGGDIYGRFPSLYSGNDLDTGRGRLIPTTSVDEYFAELAMWFGVSSADLPLVLPNLSRFYTAGSGAAPVGFLNGGPVASRRQIRKHTSMPTARRPQAARTRS